MSVLIVFVLSGVVAGTLAAAGFVLVNRDASRVTRGPVHATASAVQHELEVHHRFRSFLRDRVTPAEVTGLALTAALLMLVLVAVLAFEVRRQSFVAHFDLDVARWAARHATVRSTRFLDRFTDLGSTIGVLAITVVVATVELIRTRTRGVVVFLAVTVIGVGFANNLAKAIVGRPRPEVDQLVHVSGMSFPSGHSAAAAACFAACALCLGRRRSLTARLAITVVAAAFAVMVAMSRVLLGVHWASDAIAGLCFGTAWFALCAIAFGGRLLRFGAPVEAAARVDAAARVEVDHGSEGEPRTDHDGDRAEHGPDGHVREEVHAEDHP
jgi:undecaprenyl-diphosphatase